MRRLPVYLLIDCSGSMAGEPIEAVRHGVRSLVEDLRRDPMALGTAVVSVITFASTAQQICPLTELEEFQEPYFDASGSTALGEALELLDQCIHKEVRKTTVSQKGDWKPLVFLMTDGQPTDCWENVAERIKQKGIKVIACAAGLHADFSMLNRITEMVIELSGLRSDSLNAFFKWASSSIKTTSQGVTHVAHDATVNLPPPPPAITIVPTETVTPEVVSDRVHFTVTCPSHVIHGMSFVLSIWAHMDIHRSEVIRRCHQAVTEPIRVESKGPVRIARGSYFTMHLSVEGILVATPEDLILWDGEIGNATFVLFVPICPIYKIR